MCSESKMTRDDIIRMARSAIRLSINDSSLTEFDAEKTIIDKAEFLYWFAKEIAANEREMNLREAAQQALDFIVASNKSSQFWLVPASNLNKTVTALRAALVEGAMHRLTDEQQEMEKTHTSVDNEYTPVKPVAWRWPTHNRYAYSETHSAGEGGQPLYTAPPKRKPLTDEEIETVADSLPADDLGMPTTWHLRLARAIERAHGIGGEE